jgi:cobalt/nickel transport system permease protein
MIDEVFAHKDSIIHKIDPRFRIVGVCCYSFTVALLKDFDALFVSLFFSIILAGFARLDFFALLKRIMAIFGFLFFIWITLPLSYEGEALFKIGIFTATKEGVLYSSMITLKSISIALAFTSLAATMNINVLGNALNSLKLSEKFVHLLLITYRYLFVFKKEYERLFRAAKIRGFKPKTNMHSYKTFAGFAGMLFIKAVKRGERVHLAMLCRGFKGRFYCLEEFRIQVKDWIFAAIMSFCLIFMIILNIIDIIGNKFL